MIEQLVGQSIVEVMLNYSLTLITELRWFLVVESEFTVNTGAGPTVSMTPVPGEQPEWLSALVGAVIESASISTDGGLELMLGSTRLTVDPDPDYEPWSVIGPGHQRIVALPGGDQAVWSGDQ